MKAKYTLAHLPPSVNHIYGRGAGGKVWRTEDYMTWANSEGWTLKAQLAKQPKFSGPVYIVCAMKRPRTNSDIDNRLKGIGDLLQSIGAIANDKHIYGWNAYWSNDLKDCSAEISITEADELTK